MEETEKEAIRFCLTAFANAWKGQTDKAATYYRDTPWIEATTLTRGGVANICLEVLRKIDRLDFSSGPTPEEESASDLELIKERLNI